MALLSLLPASFAVLLALCCGEAAAQNQSTHEGCIHLPVIHSTNTNYFSKRAVELQLANRSDVAYYAQLSIGTPPQQVFVQLDTGSFELWVNPDCTAVSGADAAFCQRSSTAKSLGTTKTLQYGIGSANITYFTDTITLAGSATALRAVQFGVATSSEDEFSGILGIGYGQGIATKYLNFVDQLSAQNATKVKAYTLALGSKDSQEGVIVFGGVDTSKFRGNLTKLPIIPAAQSPDKVPRFWIDMDSISLTPPDGKPSAYAGSSMPVFLDSGSTMTLLPPNLTAAIADDFGAAAPSSNGFFQVDCDLAKVNGTLNFAFSGTTVSVPYKELIREVQSNPPTCFLGISPSSSFTLLGDTFLRSAYGRLTILFRLCCKIREEDAKAECSNAIWMTQASDCGSTPAALNNVTVLATVTGACGLTVSETTDGSSSSASSAPDTASRTGSAIPPELRSEIAAKTAELGGVHKYDLTPDATHLIVGEYDTPKYRHAMAAGWVEADVEIDFSSLESKWQLKTFETGGGEPTAAGLLCCLTGFEDPEERQQIVDKIEANGGRYTGDLTRRPEGRKYQAAKNWGLQTVSLEWVNDSVERGMILDEQCYDPILPKEERGKGAWTRRSIQRVSLGKRLRQESVVAQDEGRRKLRKTASMKLNTQRDNLWGDILGKQQTAAPSPPADSVPVPVAAPAQPSASASASLQLHAAQPSGKSMDTQRTRLSSFGPPEDGNIFAACCFHVHGFSTQKREILVNTVSSLGGLVCHSIDEVVSASGAQLSHRFLIVPQTSAPDTHPPLPDNVHIITEFYIERCLHKKYFFDPSAHVIGRPFASFPIPGFETLSICSAGFTGVDLNQVDKAIRQLGAKYEERFTAEASLLLCTSTEAVRKQKLDLALAWKVPVVRADWLWECVSTGFKVPIKGYHFPELKQKLAPEAVRKPEEPTKSDGQEPNPVPKAQAPSKLGIRDFDFSAFTTKKVSQNHDAFSTEPATSRPRTTEEDSDATTHFETAPTHQLLDNTDAGRKCPPPLSEASSSALNKPPSPRKQNGKPLRRPMSRITSEIADSEAMDDDLGQPSDLARDDNGQENESVANADPQQEERPASSRKLGNEEKAARAAAERLAMSSKLVSLLESAGRSTTSATSEDADGGATGIASAVGTTISRPSRRRREILGRASTGGAAGSNPSNKAKALLGVNWPGDGSATTAPEGDGARQVPPPATQIEYEDPEAKLYKAQLMNKMLGTAPSGKDSLPSVHIPRQERLEVAETAGYADHLRSGRERRTRRRG
ncbi:hypothetical protein QBC46DRAFT_361276 [Diplogelasinospora grovesii]|uniref:Uncharacterized protein n=1 Tax=Diplogelasinospora grovesii TaxID=303347 RepID=A0AAN6NFV7_9PEZI|nr:hypothetical protein QBC46DRAFT_361276 [Diplogelasinospora grovesii]